MTRVNVEYIEDLLTKIGEFNRLNLSEVEFYEGGKKIEIPLQVIKDFEFTGLVNKDFVAMRFWEETEEALG